MPQKSHTMHIMFTRPSLIVVEYNTTGPVRVETQVQRYDEDVEGMMPIICTTTDEISGAGILILYDTMSVSFSKKDADERCDLDIKHHYESIRNFITGGGFNITTNVRYPDEDLLTPEQRKMIIETNRGK